MKKNTVETTAEPKRVLLKNGHEETAALVARVMALLRSLLEEETVVFYELVKKCRKPTYQFFFENTGEQLKERSLIQPDDSVHGSIQNIVLSATSGAGFGLGLHSPIKQLE